MFKYWLYRVSYFLVSLFSLKVSYAISDRIFDLVYVLNFKDRHSVSRNFKKILPEGCPVGRQDREMFRNFGRYLVDLLSLKEILKPENIHTQIKIENEQRLRDCLKKGKGAIVLTAHVGSWELGAAFLGVLGFPLSVIALEHRNKRVNQFFNEQRNIFGLKVVTPKAAMRRGVSHLKNNGILAIVGDRDFLGTGVIMDFFGYPTRIPKGAAYFCQRVGSPIVPVFLVRNDDNTFTLKIEEPINPEIKDDKKDENVDLEPIMRKIVSVIENQIRAQPSQWLMFREFCE